MRNQGYQVDTTKFNDTDQTLSTVPSKASLEVRGKPRIYEFIEKLKSIFKPSFHVSNVQNATILKTVKIIPLGQKQKREAPDKTKKALIIQSIIVLIIFFLL